MVLLKTFALNEFENVGSCYCASIFELFSKP